jgi:hypothetical protein
MPEIVQTANSGQASALERARTALDRQDALRPGRPAEGGLRRRSSTRGPAAVAHKREDTSAGCRELADGNIARAALEASDLMRLQLERSAAAWTSRADLLLRLETAREAKADG